MVFSSEVFSCANEFRAITFSSIQFNVHGLQLSSLIHLELSFVQGDKYRSTWTLLKAQYGEDSVNFSLSGFFIKKSCGFMSGSSDQIH